MKTKQQIQDKLTEFLKYHSEYKKDFDKALMGIPTDLTIERIMFNMNSIEAEMAALKWVLRTSKDM